MPSVGGPIDAVEINGREFACAGDADTQRNLGGASNEVALNGNNRTARLLQTPSAWSVEGLALDVDDSQDDQSFLQDARDLKRFYPCTVTYASGVTYAGTGQITGDMNFSSASTTVSLSLGGQGKLTKQ